MSFCGNGEVNYKYEKEKHFDNVQNAFEVAFEAYRNYMKEWEDWNDDEWDLEFKDKLVNFTFKHVGCTLNYFYYDDTWSSSCGDRGGHYTGLLTYLTEDEVKDYLKKYVKDNKEKDYCPHRFLSYLRDYGVYYNERESVEFFGEMMGSVIGLSSFSEKDLLPAEEYNQIVKARKEAENAKKEAEDLARRKRIEDQERSQYEQLKKKFG